MTNGLIILALDSFKIYSDKWLVSNQHFCVKILQNSLIQLILGYEIETRL